MFYHANVHYFNKIESRITWTNYTKEMMLDKILIPFINGQVIHVTTPEGAVLFNMKSALQLFFYKTEKKLVKIDDLTPLQQVREASFKQFNCTEEIIDEFSSTFITPIKSDLERKFSPIVNNTVFIIMMFGDKELDSAFEGVIEPVIREFDLIPIRVDKLQDSGVISNQIIDSISTSKYIIADLTGERPNTYYEAGFAHALGKEMIFTIKKGHKIHFDLSGHRFIQWQTESDLRKQLKERFNALKSAENK